MGYIINKFVGRRKLEEIYHETVLEGFKDKVFKVELTNSVKYAEATTLKTDYLLLALFRASRNLSKISAGVYKPWLKKRKIF